MTDLTDRVANLTPEKRELLRRRLASLGAAQDRPASRMPALTIVPDPRARHEPFPLTDIQQAYWLGRGASFELGGVACHIYLETESPTIDTGRMERAVRCVMARHDMLRAVIRPDGRQQTTAAVEAWTLRVLDLRAASPAEAALALTHLRAEMAPQVLPTDRAPMFDIRATVLNGRVRMHWSFDILIVDAHSQRIFFRDLKRFYEEPDVSLPALELSFRDCVLAAGVAEKDEAFQRAKDYWFGRVNHLPPPPDLPLVTSPMAVTPGRFVRRSARLDAERWTRLKQRARRAGVTPSAVLLGAYADVLATWSKSPRFTLNLTVFNRPPSHPDIGSVLGDFTSISMLEIEAAAATFEARVRGLQQQLWSDLDHRLFSGVRVLRELAHRQGSGGGAMMPVVFTSIIADDGAEPDESTVWLGETIYAVTQTPQVWLDNIVYEEGATLVVCWDAVEALFPSGVLDEMFAAYERHLERLADAPTAWQESRGDLVGALLPASQIERRAIVNATAAPVSEQLLQTLFEAQVSQRPDAPAVIAPTRTLTYADLSRRANQVAHWLRAHGAKPNTLVAVVMEKGWEQVVAVLGVLTSGAAYLPIDASLPAARLQYLLEHGQVTFALTQSRHDAAISWPAEVARVSVDDMEALSLDAAPLAAVQQSGDIAYVIYTSGSTGAPKGVVIDHRGAVNTILDVNQRFGVTAEDRVLALSALNFDLSVYDIFGLLAAGGTIVMPEAHRERDPAHWADLVERHGVTRWNTVPALMQMLVEYEASRGGHGGGALRLVMLSGDWIPIDLPDRIRRLWPSVAVISLGGATEASIWSIVYPIGDVDATWTSIPYGAPMVNQTFHVLDTDLEPRPVWVPGELYIGGIGVARGYWRDEEKTRASFIAHPKTGERLYRTGDLGRYLPDGNIEFLGRQDFQVKIRGHRIELGEIEATLLQHREVKAAVVSAVGDERGSKRLVAHVVPSGSRGPRASAEASSPDALGHPIAALRFKLGRPGLRDVAGGPAVDLASVPREPTALAPFVSRRSYRDFLPNPTPGTALGELLANLFHARIDRAPLPKARYGSAGSLYPVQAYVLVKPNGVTGIAAGSYYYHPERHQLVPLPDAPAIDRRAFVDSAPMFDHAGFVLCLVGRRSAIEPLYGSQWRDFCLIEAGAMCQLLEMNAPPCGIGLCQVGGVDAAAVSRQCQLDDYDVYLHGLLGGAIDPRAPSLEAYLATVDGVRALTQAVGQAHGRLGDELRAFVADRLPDYMVPSTVMVLDALPLSSNGKVDRKALPSPRLVDPAPAAAPRSDREQIIAAIWSDVLQVDHPGLHDNFFDLGGDSVTAIQVVGRAATRGLRLSPSDIFEHQTIAELAAAASTARDAQDEAVPPDVPAVVPVEFGWSQDDVDDIARALQKRDGHD